MAPILKAELSSDSVQALCASDPKLRRLIGLVGGKELTLKEDGFEALVMSIVGQQLSAKAASTIRGRVRALCKGEVTPESVLSLTADELRAAGLSQAKTVYVQDLAARTTAGELDFALLACLPDDEVIRALTAIKGIGKWTAEMFLIFALGRTDVMSYADAGLQRAARWLHELEESPKSQYLQQVEHLWSPYRSIASLYLWESIDQGYVDSGKRLDDLIPMAE